MDKTHLGLIVVMVAMTWILIFVLFFITNYRISSLKFEIESLYEDTSLWDVKNIDQKGGVKWGL